MTDRASIAEQLLAEMLGGPVSFDDIFAPCPGRQLHTRPNGRKDFRVMLDGAPTGHCMHGSCADEVAKFNKELRRRIWFAEHGRDAAPRGHWGDGVSAEPKADVKARPAIDMTVIEDFTRGIPELDNEWLQRRSPVDVRSATSEVFFASLYQPGERVLIFTSQWSQGDFLWCNGGRPVDGMDKTDPWHGGWRLAQERGTCAVRSALPKGGREGVWFLGNPASGKWEIIVEKKWDEKEGGGKECTETPKYTRRSWVNVTAWRYFVLESDSLPAETWLRVLANLPLPIAAVYTSGGRSIHALMRMQVSSKAEWDAVNKNLKQIVCPLGADPAALSAVRLTRLPGCVREGTRDKDGRYTRYAPPRMQELLFLNPSPEHKAIRLMQEVRE